LWSFLSATFGAGVNAAHCPITCPKRRIPGTLDEIKTENVRRMRRVHAAQKKWQYLTIVKKGILIK
jgi:hypothetical protein